MTYLNPILGATTGLMVAWLVASAVPPAPFIEVHSTEVVGDQVFVERTVNGPGRAIADWRVTVVNVETDQPYCQTFAGQELHEGWSVYTPVDRGLISMSLDDWVGDEGCYERLTPDVEYVMLVTWTPRDERDPVTDRRRFIKPS